MRRFDWEGLEHRAPLILSSAFILAALVMLVSTVDRVRMAHLRANGSYVLIDNRTREEVVVDSRYRSGGRCMKEEKRVAAGNRARVRACSRWSALQIRHPGRLGGVSIDAEQGTVVEVRKLNGRLDAKVQEIY